LVPAAFAAVSTPTPVSERVDDRQAAGLKIITESLSQHNEKHVVSTPLSEIMVGQRRKRTDLKSVIHVIFLTTGYYFEWVVQARINTDYYPYH
jgi:hypothetical protein